MTRAICLALIYVLGIGTASAVDFDERQRDVWRMEEAYWHYVSSGDVEPYVALWHDDFVGWPCFSWTPERKANIGSWVAEIRDNKWTLDYAPRPEAVQLFGEDIAVVHYAAEYVFGYPDGTSKGKGDWRKFTHTWLKVRGEWKIIGGMCADQKPVRSLRSQPGN